MKSNIFRFIIVMLFSFIVLSCNNQGARDNQNDGSDSVEMNDNATGDGMSNDNQNNDQDFIEEAAHSGLMEVELGRYAQQAATNARVKNFAAMMVKDHSKANDELRALAAKKNITIPASMDEKHMDNMNDIREKRGADFDKEYMKNMVDMHEKDVDKFRRQSENATDPDIKAFAAKTLPVLITHQDSAKSIRDALK